MDKFYANQTDIHATQDPYFVGTVDPPMTNNVSADYIPNVVNPKPGIITELGLVAGASGNFSTSKANPQKIDTIPMEFSGTSQIANEFMPEGGQTKFTRATANPKARKSKRNKGLLNKLIASFSFNT